MKRIERPNQQVKFPILILRPIPADRCLVKYRQFFESKPKITDSAKVNIGKVGDKTMALGEPLMQIQIDPETLDSLGVFHFDKDPGSRMTTAHPHSDNGKKL